MLLTNNILFKLKKNKKIFKKIKLIYFQKNLKKNYNKKMGGIIGCSPSLNYSILQWNTLCSTLATKESFPKVDENSLLWENRKKLIKEFLTQENPDILTIEEIDNFENFQNYILNNLPIKYIGNFFEKVDKKMGIYLGINPDKFLVIEEKKEV